MRQLVIVCESSHADAIRDNAKDFCHPALLDRFVSVIPVDTEIDGPFRNEQDQLYTLVRNQLRGTSDRPLVCYTPMTADALKIIAMSQAYDFEIRRHTLRELSRTRNGTNNAVPLQSRMNECGLTLRGAAVEILRPWVHSTIDRAVVDNWLAQFGQLGTRFRWIGEEILACVELTAGAELGELFGQLSIPSTFSLCINRDPRKTAKSGDVISNLLTKRHPGIPIHVSPAEAIDTYRATQLAVFEDGLWSGTEALGIVESLLGLRDGKALKTPALQVPQKLREVELVFGYGVATDYGIALLTRFLRAMNLEAATVRAARVVNVTSPEVLRQLESDPIDFNVVREIGPAGGLHPYVFAALAARGVPAADVEIARRFCSAIGEQLLTHYLNAQIKHHGWTMWPADKLQRASLGMHGLGMVHAFGHSVPKASLPLLWRAGRVTYEGRTVDWQPLFQNA